MTVKDTELEGVKIIEPKVFGDHRGYFFESYNHEKFSSAIGYEVNFVQDNESLSKKGILRGLHFQKPPMTQAKLVRVVTGSVLDVVVDLRQSSPTFGHYAAIELSEDNRRQLFVPRGFAHAFLVLSDEAIFQYKVDNYYSLENDAGIIYNDTDLNIDWPDIGVDFQLSDKDKSLPSFKECFKFD